MRLRPLRRAQLTAAEKNAQVDLMADGMTDPRVANESAPFDHPSFNVANGPSLPAVGKFGRTAIGLGPLQPSLGVNHFLPIPSCLS